MKLLQAFVGWFLFASLVLLTVSGLYVLTDGFGGICELYTFC